MSWNVKSKCVQTHKYIIAKGSDCLGVNHRFISLELCFHGQFPHMLHLYFLVYKMGIKMTLTHWNLEGWSLFLYVCFCCCLVTQSCPTLCNPMDCSPPGSSVRGICQARILGVLLPFPPPVALSNPGTEPASLESPPLSGGFFTTGTPGKPISPCKVL